MNHAIDFSDHGRREIPSNVDRQLCLDLDQDLSFPPSDTSLDMFEREMHGKDLLLELAKALGELRATIDIELFRASLKGT